MLLVIVVVSPFEAVRSGAEYVLGIDIVDRYIEQANFIKRALGFKQLEFKKMAIEDLDESIVNQYDIIFVFGILYHLENPVLAMKKLSSVTRRIIVVDTNIVRIPFTRKPVWLMNFPPQAMPESLDATSSFWRTERVCQFTPNMYAVTELLKFLGFSNVTLLKPKEKGLEKRYYQGKWMTFLAI